MLVSITREIVTDLKITFPNITTLREYPLTSPKFPCVIVTEGTLEADIDTLDSGGYNHNNYEVSLEIFTKGTDKISKCEEIRDNINSLIVGDYGLERIQASPIPNLGDLNVYRYRLTYVGKLDKNKTIYRR